MDHNNIPQNQSIVVDELPQRTKEQFIRHTTIEIARIMRATNLTQSGLAKIMDTKPSWIHRVVGGKQNLTLGSLFDIAEAMNADIKITMDVRTPTNDRTSDDRNKI